MAQRRPYNPNTQYGRRKIREQYWQDYQNATPQEKAEMDNFRAGCWIIAIIAMVIMGIIVYSVSGPEGLRKWLK